jgi:hypothetical protein
MFSKIISSTCLSELLFNNLSDIAVKEFIGTTCTTDVISSILSSELSSSVMIINTNLNVVSDQAAFLILMSRWALDLGYDVLGTMANMSLIEYSDKLELQSVRICVCGGCPGTGSLTYKDCGPHIQRELTQLEKLSFLRSLSDDCFESMRAVDLITESFYDRKSAMISLVASSDYRGIVRLNACGCGSCNSFDVYLELGQFSHVTRTPGGFWLTKLTAENCKVPFVTDFQWLDVFQNVIVMDPGCDLEWYKVELPLYSKSLRMILKECGVDAGDFQKLMANTKCFKKFNKKYGMRTMLKLTITYNMWAEIQDLPRIRAFCYNDKRLIKQASEFLTITGLNKPIAEKAGDRGALVKDIKSAVLEIGVVEVPLPVKDKPVVKQMIFSEVFTKMMEEMELEDPFECLEKKSPGLKDLYMRTMCDNIEKLPLEIDKYTEKMAIKKANQEPDRGWLTGEGFLPDYTDQAFQEFGRLTTFGMDNQKEIKRFLKEVPGVRHVTNESLLKKEFSMELVPKSKFEHEDLAECDDPPVQAPLRKHELMRYNNWQTVEKAYLKKGVRIGLKPIFGLTTAEEYANEIVKNTSIPLEDALEIYSWNEIVIKERQHRAPKPFSAGKGVCKVYKKRIKRQQLEIPFRVHRELELNKMHIERELMQIDARFEEKKVNFLKSSLGVPLDPRKESEFMRPKPLNNRLMITDNHVEMEKALVPNKGIVLSNKFTNFVRQKFREDINPFLRENGYEIGADYKLKKVGRAIESLERMAKEVSDIVRGIGPRAGFKYDRIMEEYIAEHGGEPNPLSNLYDRCVKHFNQALLKQIRNRRNFSRMILLTDDDKAKLIVGLSCKEYGLIKTIKDDKKLRATEVRKICSKFFRHECFG